LAPWARQRDYVAVEEVAEEMAEEVVDEVVEDVVELS
jgi:hypothetical protein